MTTEAGADRRVSAAGKVVLVVEALIDHGSVSDIARATGLPTSTAHRILRELTDLGWVLADGERGYLLGPRIMLLASRVGRGGGLGHVARPYLLDLCKRTTHTVHFALRQGDEAVYVDKIEGSRAYAMRSRVGMSLPLHCTAIGKAVLAMTPEPEVRKILERNPMKALTTNTITDPDELMAHLRTVARRGHSVDNEENESHTRCIGAAVLDHRGVPIGGVSLSALAFDLDLHQIRTIAPQVIKAAREVSRAIGYRG